MGEVEVEVEVEVEGGDGRKVRDDFLEAKRERAE